MTLFELCRQLGANGRRVEELLGGVERRRKRAAVVVIVVKKGRQKVSLVRLLSLVVSIAVGERRAEE